MADTKKKLGLVIHTVWFWIAWMFFVPLLVQYLFDSESYIADFLGEIITIGLPARLLIRYRDKRKEKKEYLYRIEDVSLKRLPHKGLMGSMLSCVSLFLFVTYAINTAQLVYYLRTKEFYSFSTVEEFHLLGFTMALIINALLPALLEEILYRGLYRDAFRNHNKFIAIFIPSLVFASLHANIIPMSNAFLLGMLLMILYQRSGSLKLVIILHAVYNILGIIFNQYVALPFTTLSLFNSDSNEMQIVYALVISIAVTLLSLVMIFLSVGNCFKGNNPAIKINRNKSGFMDIIMNIFFFISAVLMIILKITNPDAS